MPGDANVDGKVDINDLTIVLANYNQTGMTWAQGEFTGDGTVDINDLTIVLANYNDDDWGVGRRHRRRARAGRMAACWPPGWSACWPTPGGSENKSGESPFPV